MTRAQLEALLARNPQISSHEDPVGAQLPAALAQPDPLSPLDPSASDQTGSVGSVSLRVISWRCRLLDYDNLVAGAKALIDGLAQAGLIPGDGPDQIETEYCQQKVKHRQQEATVVEIIYR